MLQILKTIWCIVMHRTNWWERIPNNLHVCDKCGRTWRTHVTAEDIDRGMA